MSDYLAYAKPAAAVVMLTAFWCWETWRPCFGFRSGRWQHAALNIAIALFNTVVLGLTFGIAAAETTAWAARHEYGLLHQLNLPTALAFACALLLLDAWMYLWHRANHVVPLLWRFHRMHHADRHVDVTTATRFHVGEHVGSVMLRLALIPILGLEIWHVVVYDALVLAVTQFHHADIDLGSCDRWLRLVIVTPNMHKVHHSDWQPETDSNYATVLSIWDRLLGSFRSRTSNAGLVFGLEEFKEPVWQTWRGMWKMPFVTPGAKPQPARSHRLVRITFF